MNTETEVKETKTVTMADGSTIEFGVRASKKSNVNLAEGTMTINIVTGEQHTLNVTDVSYLTDYYSYPSQVRRLIMDGIKAKVNSFINNSGEEDIGKSIAKCFDQFRNGTSATRLTTFRGKLKKDAAAYAIFVMSYADNPILKGITFSGLNWSNLDDSAVIADVKESWTSLTKKQRNGIRRNAHYMNIYSNLLLGNSVQPIATPPEASHTTTPSVQYVDDVDNIPLAA